MNSKIVGTYTFRKFFLIFLRPTLVSLESFGVHKRSKEIFNLK
ncbi:hypothetical protein LEP1GSC173_0900 [Leptospira interrogans str. HAI1594]|uniref:Uncharacterized protein n=1 Tax=Leptospira interrogans serovar Hardjo str. Norma TaxID=1279460 RepID=A0A0M4NWB5_LEPIR|nr:hypothetical protein G436_1018 [Leptospira interrogans serovar Hardjo str. Norma]EKP76414.1 hypothetical protein LEP1GSC173_0900 [Leptospira interrogans str. HAI1594]